MRSNYIKIDTIFLHFFLILFILSSVVISMEISTFIELFFLIFGGSCIVIFTFLKCKQDFKLYYTKLDIIYSMFVILGMISSFINNDATHFFSISKLLFIYFVLVICQRNAKKIYNFSTFINSYIIISLGIIILSVIQFFPLNTYNYSGIFGNPNNFGVFSSTLFVYFLAVFIGKYTIYKKISILNLLILLILFYFVVISSSRTAMYGILTVIFSLIILLSYLETDNKALRVLLMFIFVGGILLVILSFLNSTNISEKFDSLFATSEEAKVSRITIWEGILKNATLFGGKSNEILRITGHTSHNTFLEQIGRYGILSGVFYILFWLSSLIKSFRYFINNYNNDGKSIIVFSIIFIFIIMSLVEQLSLNTTMFISLFLVGYLQEQTQRVEKKVSNGRNINFNN